MIDGAAAPAPQASNREDVMFGKYAAYYNNNPILQWLWKHGWEEPVGPLGPVARATEASAMAERFGPSPEPWRVAVPQLVEAAQARAIAEQLHGPLKEQGIASANRAISAILDDWCGTHPRLWPWPWPGPPPWSWEIASELSLIANSLQQGELRTALLDVSRQVVETANARPG